MEFLSLLVTLAPLGLIFVLLLMKSAPADVAGVCGWLSAMIVACLYFGTPVSVALTASLSGVVASLPIGFAMGASGFQVAALAESGALSRIIAFTKTVAPADRYVQVLLINCGLGILMTSFGAVTIAIFPPILMALGYGMFASIALPCIGYTGACIYAIMGVPVLIFATQADLSLRDSGLLFADFLPLVLSVVSLASLWIAGRWEGLKRGWIAALAASILSGLTALPLAHYDMVPLTGIVVGAVYVLVLLCMLKGLGRPTFSGTELQGTAKSSELAPSGWDPAPAEQGRPAIPLGVALSPWLALIVFSIAVNTPALPFFKIFFTDLSMPLEIIPGKPDRLRIFWQSYFWIPVATLICVPVLRLTGMQIGVAMRSTLRRASRPVVAIALFFAIASLYMYSGFSADWQAPEVHSNMVGILSAYASELLGNGYAAAAPFLGLLGGVISGSQSASVAMLTRLHLGVAGYLGVSGSALALFSALGAGFSGAISPAKVMTAAAVIDHIGEEGAVLRATLGIVLLVTLITGAVSFFWMLRWTV